MIAVATTTRADWGLLLPLLRELRERGHEPAVIAANMHLLPEYGNTIDEIRASGFEPVAKVPAKSDPARTLSTTIEGFTDVLRNLKPDALVLLGDRFETLGAASAALLAGVPIVHIAGGTISEGAIDDSIRHAITKLSSLHLVETEQCRHRVIQMGEDPSTVFTVGAAGVWNALNTKLMTREELAKSLGWVIPENFIVATLHPCTRSATPAPEQMENFIKGLEQSLKEFPGMGIIFTFPNNDSDPKPLIEQIKAFASRHPGQVLAVPSLGMHRYLSAVALSKGVVGNSSSGIVETASLGVPTLNVGVRQEGREAPPSVLNTPATPLGVSIGIQSMMRPVTQEQARLKFNPYFRHGTPKLMADAILKFDFHAYPRKKFYNL
ncbi:MAG: UDP-N-acetylglucosamine 2-epimerase (hydrolyzing) [Bacteroides sp.]|nr:UDP-N-acetylglucosamine 2-epimerase (hydrolyzing) [Bacteroidales bacterium]MBD5336494.1 UDP-N-acetylglucosamine 2-epimerase (hydrolyzing) [Bacteroides sp.]